jgi:anaerobic selenocysteine-containing dehydrogenase
MPYAQYSPALLRKPKGSDLLDEWDFFFRLAREMRRQIIFKPACYSNPDEATAHAYPLDMSRSYSHEDIMAMMFKDSPVPLSEIMEKAREGHVFDVPPLTVQAKPEGWTGRFDLANSDMLGDLAEVSGNPYRATEKFPLLLLARRLRDHYNTSWHEMAALKKKQSSNYAFMNPYDMSSLGLEDGEIVEITSDAGTIFGVAATAPELLAGCVSMAHGWGVNPDEKEDPALHGGSTSRLCSTDRDCDPRNWMARQSAIPVRVKRAIRSPRSVPVESADRSCR